MGKLYQQRAFRSAVKPELVTHPKGPGPSTGVPLNVSFKGDINIFMGICIIDSDLAVSQNGVLEKRFRARLKGAWG